jgi:hypothetical protein
MDAARTTRLAACMEPPETMSSGQGRIAESTSHMKAGVKREADHNFMIYLDLQY